MKLQRTICGPLGECMIADAATHRKNPNRIQWTEEMDSTLKSSYACMGSEATASVVGATVSATTQRARKLGLVVNKEVTIRLRTDKLRNVSSSTPEMDETIRREYLNIPVKTLGAMIGKSYKFLETRLRQLGLVIPPEIIAQRKADSRIKPGHIPLNKGKSWDEQGIPEEVRERMRKNNFKKGQLPHNTFDRDGIISQRNDSRTGRPYMYIRVSLGKWREIHVVEWEKVHGKVPRGMVIAFKDGDSTNCALENLELMSMKDNMLRNSGSLRLTDGLVAQYIVGSHRNQNKELEDYIRKEAPHLIELKRKQLLLNRQLKNNVTKEVEEPK